MARLKAGSPLSVRTLRLGLFFVIFGDAFVDLRREFQVFVYVARIWIFWIRADGKLLLFLKLKHLLTAWRTIALGYDLFYQRARFLFVQIGVQLKLLEHLVFREEVSRHHYEYQPAVMANIFPLRKGVHQVGHHPILL